MPIIEKQSANELGSIDLQTVTQMSARFASDLGKQLGKSRGFKQTIPVVLGNLATEDNTQALFVPDTNNTRVYFSDNGDEPSLIGTVSIVGISPSLLRFGQNILVRKTPSGGYEYAQPDTDLADIFNEDTQGAIDQKPVTQSQLDWGTLQPYSGLICVVKGAIFGDNGYRDQLTANFASSPLDTLGNPINIPSTANRAIGVLVQLDPATGALSYKQSAQFPAGVAINQRYFDGALPLRDAPLKRIGYIKLANGIAELTNADVWTCPEWFPDSGGFQDFTVAGDSGTPQTIEDGDTLNILGGTGLSTVASATDTLTINLDNTAVTPASYTNTNLTVDAQGRITAASNGTSITLPVSIADGGTGQTSKTPAFDALSPATTKGDLIVYDGTDNVRLAAGTDYHRLRARAGATNGVEWALLFTQHLVGAYSPAANINTTSTSYADIDGTNIKQSVTIAAGETIIARFSIATVQQLTGGTGTYKLVAGATDPDTLVEQTFSNTGIGGSLLLVGKWTGLAAGTYDIKPRFKTSANTARVTQNTPVSWEVMVY